MNPQLTSMDARRAKEKRGIGSGSQYSPWIHIHEVSSKGRKHLTPGYKTGRNHHLLSDGEAKCLSILEWHTNVIDIREQFPLLPLETTLSIADRLNIFHPTDRSEKKNPIVLTIDFLIDVQTESGVEHVAVSFKKAKQLEQKTTLIRQELERRYCQEVGFGDTLTRWIIVTENEIPKILIENIGILSARTILRPTKNLYSTVLNAAIEYFTPEMSLNDLCYRLSSNLNLDESQVNSIIRQSIYHGIWQFDLLGSRLDFSKPFILNPLRQNIVLPDWAYESTE